MEPTGIAEVLSIGDEITSGAIADTNAQWLSLRLEQMGLRVLRHGTVGDDLAAITDAFQTAIERSDVIVATGGLGPTADDLTRESLAKAAGVELTFFPDAYEHCRQLFERRGRMMPEQNRLQAISPIGTRHIPNPDGTALGIDLTVPRDGRLASRVFCVPGVPAEMRVCWKSIERSLREAGYGKRRIAHRLIHCYGVGESQAESMLPDLIRRGRDPLVGITAKAGTITLRIQAEGDSESECEAKISPVANQIRTLLSDFVYGEGDTTLPDAVIERLVERKLFRVAIFVCGDSAIVVNELYEAARRYRQKDPEANRGVVEITGVLLSEESAVQRVFPEIESQITEIPPASLVEELSKRVQKRFQADFGIVVWNGAIPMESEMVYVGISGPGREPTGLRRDSSSVHPAIRELCVAKTVWNAIFRW